MCSKLKIFLDCNIRNWYILFRFENLILGMLLLFFVIIKKKKRKKSVLFFKESLRKRV